MGITTNKSRKLLFGLQQSPNNLTREPFYDKDRSIRLMRIEGKKVASARIELASKV